MSWRDRAKPSSVQGAGDRPTLEAVLDHYGVDHNNRTRGMCRCPLHEDNTPSFSMNTEKQVWNCHSCGNGGDSWKLIELKEGIDFAGARAFAGEHRLITGPSAGSQGRALRGSRQRRGGVSATPYVPSWRRSPE